jgi:UDP-N-acetylglucosamine 2-epimerase (non-hydrolysing)
MAGHLFEAMGCPPDATWELSGTEGQRVGALLGCAFEELEQHRPDALLVLGDTYTAPLTAMAARRHGVGVVHLEAGLRSFNERSMEELNRRMMADLATVHLAPTEMAASFLSAEGVAPERIRVVGNPVIDALDASGVARIPVEDRRGVLITAHRATNVDDPVRLAELVTLVRRLGDELGPVVFPVHPRTQVRLEDAGLLSVIATAPGVELMEPLPYEDLLVRLATSRLVVTDSGGLQEEASYFGVPAVVLRATTPRWESVESGAVRLTGLDAERAMDAARVFSTPNELRRVDALPCPYGSGDTSDRVVNALRQPELLEILSPAEPGGAVPAAVSAGWDVWAESA